MLNEINKKEKKRFYLIVILLSFVLFATIILSIMLGQYELGIMDTLKAISNIVFRSNYENRLLHRKNVIFYI